MEPFTEEFVISTAVSLTTTSYSPSIDVSKYNSGQVQAVYNYTSGNSAGTATIQYSLDNVNFDDDPDSSLSYSSNMDPTNNLWNITKFAGKYLRVAHTHQSGTGGTVTIRFFGKSL